MMLTWNVRSLFRRQIKRSNRNGSVLIVVLWMLFFLCGLAVALHSYVGPRLMLASKLKNKNQDLYANWAAIKLVMAQTIANSSETETTLKEPWSAKGLVDEERKININTASADVLKNFFEAGQGLPAIVAGELAASILNWRAPTTSPDGICPDEQYYRSLNPPYLCKGRSFEVLEELLLVKGMTPPLFEKAKGYLTLYGNGAVNINTADPIVLQGFGMSPALVDKIADFRKEHVFSKTAEIASSLQAAEALTPEEGALLSNMVAAGTITVRSEHFTGTAGTVTYGFNRSRNILFWREG